MELYTDLKHAERIIEISQSFGIEAQVIGYCELFKGKKLTIKSEHGTFVY
jgi:phosphoribosylformylglycinamidine cyclo-ligase